MKVGLLNVSVLFSALLAGCGGGGGGTGVSTGASAPSPAPTAGGGNLATSVPTPTYAAGSPQLDIFNQINNVRLKGGFGMMAQDVVLDTAATSHTKYLIANYFNAVVPSGIWWNPAVNNVDPNTGWLMGHVEVAGSPGFSGVLPVNRVAAAGAQFSYVGEVVSYRVHISAHRGRRFRLNVDAISA